MRSSSQIILDVQLASKLKAPIASNIMENALAVAKDFCGFNTACELTLRMVDDKEMIYLNKTYRHKEGLTNILSFPYDGETSDGFTFIGDLVVSGSVIEKEAKDQGKSIENHFMHILIHGFLHLLGYDHIQADEAEEMEELEVKILNRLGIKNPYE